MMRDGFSTVVAFFLMLAPLPSVAQPGATAKGKSAGSDALLAKEKEAWDAFKHKQPDAFKHLAAPEFVGVDPDGPVDLAAEVKSIDDVELKDYRLADVKVIMADKDTALLTYKAMQQGTYKGQPLPPAVFASSVWVRRGGKWLAVFHQETTARVPPP